MSTPRIGRVASDIARFDFAGWLHHNLIWFSLGFLVIAVARFFYIRRGNARLRKTAPARNVATKIAPLVGYPKATKAKDFVKWPRNPQATGTVITVRYAPNFHPRQSTIDNVSEIITSICGGQWRGLHDPSDAMHNRLRFQRMALPGMLPNEYAYENIGPIHQVPFAIDADGHRVIADMHSQSPHVLIGGNTGKGKTTTISVFVAHIASRGGLVDILDPKMIGYLDTFDRLGNVRVADSVQDIITRVAEFHADMTWRYEQRKARRSIAHLPTRLLVIDEMASFTTRIRDDWADKRQPQQPPSSPTERQLLEILHMGRAADMHLVIAAQQANANVIGSTDKREQFDCRIGCGAPGKRGGSLLFGTDDIPRVDPEVKGRGLVALTGGDVLAVQLAYIAEGDTQALAAQGSSSFTDYERGAPHLASEIPLTSYGNPVQQTDQNDTAGMTGTVMKCQACGTEYVTLSKSVSRCRCGHRQRIPAVLLTGQVVDD